MVGQRERRRGGGGGGGGGGGRRQAGRQPGEGAGQQHHHSRRAGKAQRGFKRIPFVSAAHEHVESAFDVSQQPGAAAVTLGPFDVPAYGFLRSIFLLVTCSGGVAGSGVLAGDAPWSVFQEITLLDVNGAPIYGPFTGYQAFLSNIFGGYTFRSDPALQPDANLTSVAAFTFGLRIPVEISHHDGLGALPNQNAAASYKVRLVMNIGSASAAGIWSDVTGMTIPTIRVRGYLEAWSLPDERDLAGRPQSDRPPKMGTTQYWSMTSKPLSANANQIVLPRVGNLIRGIIFVVRNASAVRTTAVMADPIEIDWDARQLTIEPQYLRRTYTSERYIMAALPAGVFPFFYNHAVAGKAGDEPPHLWLPTVQSTRLQITGANFQAGSLEILTNDVAPVEVRQRERYREDSATGFEPLPVGRG